MEPHRAAGGPKEPSHATGDALMMIRSLASAAVLALLATATLADEATIRKVVEAKLGGVKIEGVQPGPLGLFEVRLRKLNAIKFEQLPLDQAVKIQRGNGKRVLAMFSDPYCPACKQFEQTLQQVDDITIYVFMFPVIRPELAEQSKAVWCSPDRDRKSTRLNSSHQIISYSV